MMMMKRYFRVFNELYTHEKDAKFVLKGWEHKEKITEVFAVGENLADFVNLELDSVYLAKTIGEAMEELEAMGGDLF